jgi:hypothetical protein
MVSRRGFLKSIVVAVATPKQVMGGLSELAATATPDTLIHSAEMATQPALTEFANAFLSYQTQNTAYQTAISGMHEAFTDNIAQQTIGTLQQQARRVIAQALPLTKAINTLTLSHGSTLESMLKSSPEVLDSHLKNHGIAHDLWQQFKHKVDSTDPHLLTGEGYSITQRSVAEELNHRLRYDSYSKGGWSIYGAGDRLVPLRDVARHNEIMETIVNPLNDELSQQYSNITEEDARHRDKRRMSDEPHTQASETTSDTYQRLLDQEFGTHKWTGREQTKQLGKLSGIMPIKNTHTM